MCKLKSVITCQDLDDGDFLQAEMKIEEHPKSGFLYDAAKFDLMCEGLKKRRKKRAIPLSRRDLSDKLESEFLKNRFGHVVCDELNYSEMRKIILGLKSELELDERSYEKFSHFTARG